MEIRNFPQVQYIKELELTKKEGSHSWLRFSASILDSQEKACLDCTGSVISLLLDAKNSVFVGRVEDVAVERSFSAVQIHVTAVSLSITADEKECTRIFHNPQKKLSDVLNEQKLGWLKGSIRLDKTLSALVYEPVILQQGETAFAFLQRMSKLTGARLWVADTMTEKSEILLSGCFGTTKRKLHKENIYYMCHKKSGKLSEYLVRTNVYLEIGTAVEIEDDMVSPELVIAEVRVYLENEVICYEYKLIEKKISGYSIPATGDLPEQEPIRLLGGKVTNNNDPKNLGRIQVEFDDKFIEDMNKERPMWVSYRTPYSGHGTGIVFLPDKGDKVELFFYHGVLYAGNAYRDEPLNEECRNVSDKYIGNNTKQRIFWKEKSVELYSGEYGIIMDEKGIRLKVADNSITLTKEGILLKTRNSKLSLMKDGVLQADGKIECKSENMEFAAGSKAKISGSAIAVESNSSVNIKAGGIIKLDGSAINLC